MRERGRVFGLGGTEVLVVFVLALLLFGPRKLPEIGQMLGKTMSELRRATMDFRTSLEREVQLDKLRETGDSLRQDLSFREPRPPNVSSQAGSTSDGPRSGGGDAPDKPANTDSQPDAARRRTS